MLYERSAKDAEYMFGERITALRQTPSRVEVDFAPASTRTFDLVVGADGMHSNVRSLLFGSERAYEKHLGYYVAGWGLPNSFGATSVMDHFAEPGRSVSITGDQRDYSRAIAYCMFASAELAIDWQDVSAHKALVKRAFAGMPWRAPSILSTLDAATDLYFDAISRVQVPHYTEGRVALLGDAAWGATFGGVGPGVVGAYVLAGELAVAGSDHTRAFASCEARMRRYAGSSLDAANAGTMMAPRTALGLWLRNTILAMRPVQWLMLRGQRLASDVELPSYELGGVS